MTDETTSRIERVERELKLLARERERARAGTRGVVGIAVAGLALAPVLASAVDVPHTFSAGAAIVANEVNQNFEDLAAAVTALEDGRAGPRVLGSAVVAWDSAATASSEPGAIIDGLEVTLDTHGEQVRIELVGNGEQQPFIAGTTNNPSAQFTYRLERRTEGKDVDWVTVEEFFFLNFVGTGADASELRLPPTVITAIDEPSAGETTYRMLAWVEPFSGLYSPQVYVARVRLVAQELGDTATK